jgi:DNA-binding response OmpR family regulator
MKDYRILVVEDEASAARMIGFYLEREDFEILYAPDGPSGEKDFLQQRPHLVVLDIMLPGFDGLELCRRIRQHSTAPILMLTARAEDTDKAIGLGIGADDYLTKPFSPMELVARIKAQLRRAYHFNEQPKTKVLGGPRLNLDPTRHAVTFDESPIDLTPLEFDLLTILMANPGWAFRRSHLLQEVWGYQDEAGEDTVTAHISNLRRKLGPEGVDLIRTIHGVGYMYQEGS